LLNVELFGPRLRLPFGFEVVAKLVELIAILTGKDHGSGAKAVAEGVHADGRLSFGSCGAG
jgi:hypothetical protein